jgi:hypothetical protein
VNAKQNLELTKAAMAITEGIKAMNKRQNLEMCVVVEMWFRLPGCMSFSVITQGGAEVARFIWDAMTAQGYGAVSTRP